MTPIQPTEWGYPFEDQIIRILLEICIVLVPDVNMYLLSLLHLAFVKTEAKRQQTGLKGRTSVHNKMSACMLRHVT